MTDKNKETQIVPADQPHAVRKSPIRPDSYEQIMKLANQCAQSGLYGIKSPHQAFTIMVTGDEIGLSPFQALRGIHVIKGQPSIGANLMVALVMQCRDCEYWTVRKTTNETCEIETKRKGHDAQSITWTIADAKRAQLTNSDNWKKYPRAMLRARAISELARMVYGDIVYGMYTPEEIGDVEAIPAPFHDNREAIDAQFEDEPEDQDENEAQTTTDEWNNASRRFHAMLRDIPQADEFRAAFKRQQNAESFRDIAPIEIHKVCSRIAQCDELGGSDALEQFFLLVIQENPEPQDKTDEK